MSWLARTVGSGLFSLTIALGAQAQQPGKEASSAKPAVGSSTLTGRVLLEDGRPAEGATVDVRSVRGGTGQATLTDADGRFSVSATATDSYIVIVNLPGYFAVQTSGRFPTGYRAGDTVSIILLKGGVITGRVTTRNGDPVVGVSVSTMPVRNKDGQPVSGGMSGLPRLTDDRGIYRIFGLSPGGYLVVANPPRRTFSGISAFDQSLPVYYPSADRADAAEVAVQAGGEASGIDIYFRKVRGHAVTGTVEGLNGPSQTDSIDLMEATSSSPFSSTSSQAGTDARSFLFEGIPDGEYELLATRFLTQGEFAASEQSRIVVKGADVSGIKLTVRPLASLAGKAVLEASPGTTRPSECKGPVPILPGQVLVQASIPRKKDDVGPVYARFRSSSDRVKANGEFLLRNLDVGTFRVAARLPEDQWYVKSITAPRPGTPRSPIDIARDGIAIKPSEHQTDLTIRIAEGAGSFRGRINVDGSDGRAHWRIFLVPKAAALADDVLRYDETVANPEGNFGFRYLAPGQYWLLARPIGDRRLQASANPVAWDAVERVKLRREAESAANLVEVKACQGVSGYSLKSPGVAAARP
jgi:hypothetical protein